MKKKVTLSEIWEKTVAVKMQPNHTFLHMDVHSEELPISLMDGTGWLAWVKPLEPGHWDVGIWTLPLRIDSGYPTDANMAEVANKIFETLAEVEGAWVPVQKHSFEKNSCPEQGL